MDYLISIYITLVTAQELVTDWAWIKAEASDLASSWDNII